MDMHMNVYTWITGFSLSIMVVMLVILSARRATEAQKYVTSVVSTTFLFFLGFIIYQTGNSMDQMLVGIKIELASILTIFIVIFMVFQQVYNVLIPRIPMIAISIWFIFLCVISVFFNKGGVIPSFLFSDYSLTVNEYGSPCFSFVPDWGWYAVLITLGALELITIAIFIRALIVSHLHKYHISSSFFLVTSIPQFSVLIWLFAGINKSVFPFSPLICAAASLIATLMVCRELFSNLYDMSYKEIMNSMQNPLFIIDNSFNVRRTNKAAKVP
ncbi:MAG: hypothetical protein J6Y16_02650, partial [Treponema sp.]|nr:hypothetical protein [Treponema sp.]